MGGHDKDVVQLLLCGSTWWSKVFSLDNIHDFFFISNQFFAPPSQLLSVSAQIFPIFRPTLPTKIGLKWSYEHGETSDESRFHQR